MDDDWAARRERAIAVHAADLARREAAETDEARRVILDFLKAGNHAPAVPLTARSHDGRHRYRTRLRGWYLRSDGGLAVGEDGEFYILSVPPSLSARLRGADVPPSRPRLVIGEGGRDGERVTLRELLSKL